MATIKSYTDISQSKKLAKILPLESADMRYQVRYDNKNNLKYIPGFISTIIPFRVDIPCWSLAALINIASTYCNRLEITLRTNKKYNVFTVKGDFVFRSFDEFPDGIDNLIDCYYKIIIRLHELNLL